MFDGCRFIGRTNGRGGGHETPSEVSDPTHLQPKTPSRLGARTRAIIVAAMVVGGTVATVPFATVASGQPGWSAPQDIDSTTGVAIRSVSCATASFCVAVDTAGNALTYNGTHWTAPTSIDGTTQLNSVSCATTSFCVAVDSDGTALTTTDGGSHWTSNDLDGSTNLNSVSCRDDELLCRRGRRR